MNTYHPENTQVPADIRTASIIAGFAELYETVTANPDLRMIPIVHVDQIRHQLKQLGYQPRIRYRGPHSQQRDTHKADARAFTVYFQD